MSSEYLVIGGEGQLGKAIRLALERSSENVRYTTRRKELAGKAALHFDLDYSDQRALRASPVWLYVEQRRPTVFLCAGVTGLKECELDPVGSRRVNVANTVDFLGWCAEAGCSVIYLSSNAVFSRNHSYPDEMCRPDPTSEYGRQKADAEAGLAKLGERVGTQRISIVRLTKVVPDGRGLIDSWIRALVRGQRVEAYETYVLSPISLEYAVNGLIRIAGAHAGGVFHLSGEHDLSYLQLARMLAEAKGADPALIYAENGAQAASNAESNRQPGSCSLGMQRTTMCTGIKNQGPAAVVRDLLSSG